MSNFSKSIAIIAVILIFLIIIRTYRDHTDGFTDEMKRERAGKLYEYLKDHTGMPSYPSFKKVMPDTDAVEYIDMSLLKTKREFTVKNIEKTLGLNPQ